MRDAPIWRRMQMKWAQSPLGAATNPTAACHVSAKKLEISNGQDRWCSVGGGGHGVLYHWALEARLQCVDVLRQVVVDLLPLWVEDELHAFAASEFGCGHKVAVTCHQHDGADLLFEGEAGDVDGNAHVHTFLTQAQGHITGLQVLPGVVGIQKCLRSLRSCSNRALLFMANADFPNSMGWLAMGWCALPS